MDYSAKFKEFLSNKYPDIELVSAYTNAKTKITIKYKCGCTKEVIPSNLQSRGNGSACLIHKDGKEGNISHTKSGGLKDFESFFTEAYSEKAEMLTPYLGAHIKISIQYKNCGCIKELVPTNMRTRHDGKSCGIHESSIQIESSNNFLKFITNNYPSIEIISPYVKSYIDVQIQCKTCKNIWWSDPAIMVSQGSNVICRSCFPIMYNESEDSLYNFISDNYSGWIIRNDRKILEGKELDIVLPDLGLAFEFNGCYWHNSDHVSKLFHANKTNMTEDFGYKLIHVFEDEWHNKQDIVKSRILYLLGMANKIYARKCVIKELSWAQAKGFIENTHLRGAGAPTKINLGLFYLDELVAMQTYSTPKTNSDYEYELVRFCSKINTNVIGGASKLLKYFIKNYTPKGIISYSDRRWSLGSLYKILGFNYSHTSIPGYRYYKGLKSYSRYQFQKHALKDIFPEIYNDDLTEFEIMKLAGFTRVHDSGNDVWVLS